MCHSVPRGSLFGKCMCWGRHPGKYHVTSELVCAWRKCHLRVRIISRLSKSFKQHLGVVCNSSVLEKCTWDTHMRYMDASMWY